MFERSKSSQKKQIVLEACAFLLIFLFVYTASSKLYRWVDFRNVMYYFPWIRGYADWLAWIVPFAELGISALLLFPRTRKAGFYASFFLLLIFTVYLATMVGTQRKLPCSCGGVLRYLTWRQHIVFNLFFLVISLAGILYKNPIRRFFSPKNIVYET